MFFRDEYAFLSNMYPCEIKYKGMTFFSTEAAYQSQKTSDLEKQKEFQGYTGVQAKKMGRLLELDPGFEDRKLDIMTELIDIKFSQPDLAAALMKVTAPIVEDNTWGDTFWGCCNGIGTNHLGRILSEKKYRLLWEANSDESALLNMDNGNMLGIYQMNTKQSLCFMQLKEGERVTRDMYNLVYTEPLKSTCDFSEEANLLESIFSRFNVPSHMPKNYYGRSVSVSDLIVIRNGANLRGFYVQPVGYYEIPEFHNLWKA